MKEVHVDFVQQKNVALVHSVTIVIELHLVSASPVSEPCPQWVRNKGKSDDFSTCPMSEKELQALEMKCSKI